MKIRIYPDHPALPIGPAEIRAGSAMPICLVGVPGGASAVTVVAFNADGVAATLSATKLGSEWVCTFPASHFAAYGAISRGLQVAVTFKDATDTLQTVLFVGDVKVVQATASDPQGTGVPSVPITEVDGVPDGSSMKDIRDKVNEIARIVSGTATALLVACCCFGATPLEDIPGTNLIYTAAEVDAAISAHPSMSTNDVQAIVTNEVETGWGEWQYSVPVEVVVPPMPIGWDGESRKWLMQAKVDSATVMYGAMADSEWTNTVSRLSWFVDSEGEGSEIVFTTTRSRISQNALGLARLVDLPSVKAEAIAAASNYTDAAIAAASAAQATWSRPGDWVATATPRSVPVTAQNVNYVTNDATSTITSNIVETVYYSLSADLDVEELDELSPVDAATASALGVTFEPTNGGVVTGNVFYATDAGLYRIRATSATRGSRYADCPLTAWQQVSSNAAVYIADADLPGRWRKPVNDAFLADLTASVHAATGVVDGASYDVWWTVRCPCRPISGHTVQGYRSRNALSPHLLIGARHYGYNGNASWLTFHDPVGNTNVAANTGGLATGATAYDEVYVPADYGFPLCWWALKHGWTRAELEAMNISDIAVYPIKDGATLPDPCIPYFASLETLGTRFGGKGNIGGWAFSQTYVGRTGPDGIAAGNYMTPAIINIGNLDTATYGACTWTCAGYSWGSAVRADILARWRTMREVEGGAGSFPPIYGGDSSGGIYFKDADGRWIMVSMFTTIGSGPSLSAAVPVLRALCAEYGDTLKEVE